MPLANISVAPQKSTQAAFDYSHYIDHAEIVHAINKKHGTSLSIYPIWPVMRGKTDSWQRLHQSFHDDMNAVLKSNGKDLTGDIDDVWYNQNYREHQAARAALGI